MSPVRRSAVLPIAVSCVVGLLTAAAVAGLGANRVMGLEAQSTQAIVLLGDLSSVAGRMEMHWSRGWQIPGRILPVLTPCDDG